MTEIVLNLHLSFPEWQWFGKGTWRRKFLPSLTGGDHAVGYHMHTVLAGDDGKKNYILYSQDISHNNFSEPNSVNSPVPQPCLTDIQQLNCPPAPQSPRHSCKNCLWKSQTHVTLQAMKPLYQGCFLKLKYSIPKILLQANAEVERFLKKASAPSEYFSNVNASINQSTVPINADWPLSWIRKSCPQSVQAVLTPNTTR